MVSLNKEIINEICLLDCDENMKYFLIELLNVELDLVEQGRERSPKKYDELFVEYAPGGKMNDY